MTYEEFEKEMYALTGINLCLYKEKQMKRRINTLIERLKLDGYESYIRFLLESNENMQQYFHRYITINVTEFFRTPEQWKYVADNVMSELPGDALIWSCACSTGEEAYSLAISLTERGKLDHARIIATDIDDKVLDIATKGEYSAMFVKGIPENILGKYFAKTAIGYKVSDEIRNHIEFRKFNLLADNFPTNCDLIVCRNVLIYFTGEAKNKLFAQLSQSLSPGGHLFTGHTEQILRFKEFNLKKEKGFLYLKEG